MSWLPIPEELARDIHLTPSELEHLPLQGSSRGSDLEVGDRAILIVKGHNIVHHNQSVNGKVTSGRTIVLRGKKSPSTKYPLDKAYLRFLSGVRPPRYSKKSQAIELFYPDSYFEAIIAQLLNPDSACFVWRYGDDEIYGDVHSAHH